MTLSSLRNRHDLMVLVSVAQDAIDAQQFEVLLAECLYFLDRVQLAQLILANGGLHIGQALVAQRLVELVIGTLAESLARLVPRGPITDHVVVHFLAWGALAGDRDALDRVARDALLRAK